MATTFTKAIQLGSAFARADFGNPALLNNGSTGWTYLIGLKCDTGASGQNLLSKNSSNSNNEGYAIPLTATGSDYYSDMPFGRSTAKSTYRANPLLIGGVWSFIAITRDLSTSAVKIYNGAYGGALSDTGASDIGGGSGTPADDSAFNLILGTNLATNASIRPVEIFHFSRYNSVLSLATINTMIADLDALGLPLAALYVHPGATDTAAVDLANGNNGVFAGTVAIVDGPDTAGPSSDIPQLKAAHRRRYF